MNLRLKPPKRLFALAALALALFAFAAPGSAASPSPAATPAANPDIQMDAKALLGGHVRPGAWTAVVVTLGNTGPAVTGELRIRGPQQTQSRYGVEVTLPTNARHSYTLYAQTALFGSRVFVDLVSGEQVIATQTVSIRSHDAYSPIVAIVADKPEGIQPAITAAMTNPNAQATSVITLGLADLPPRVEAWTAIDRLVWQDVDANQLTPTQLEAMRLWVGAGGRLTLLGGTTDKGYLAGFGEDLLPINLERTIDVQSGDLATLLGSVPAGATPLPAAAGPLRHGSALVTIGNDAVAAEMSYGRGSITLVGFDPATPWIADSSAGEFLWHRLLPQTSEPALNPLAVTDDSQIIYALQNLPSVDLPPIEQLFVLLVAYIALIGPINYLVLRRLDKREWAWITIPALVIVFAFGSYGLGATLKGSDIIVNQITVVRAAEGAGRGIGQAYIGIYSPSRRSFNVTIPGGALLSNPVSQGAMNGTETPLDVVFGSDSSRLRDFEVGFGVLRGFRAEAPADAPPVDSDLKLANGRLQGTVTNQSDQPLENVAVVFGGGAAVLREPLQAGEARPIDMDVSSTALSQHGLSEVIFGSVFPRDSAVARSVSTRRAVLDQIFPWGSLGSADNPILLAWQQRAVLDVELPGDRPNRVGEGLFMIPLALTLDANQVFAGAMLRRTIVETSAANAWADASGLYLSRGTMTVESRPARLSGNFTVSKLEIAVTQGDARQLRGDGDTIEPLPADQQPDQEDPLAPPEPAASPTPQTTAPPADCANPPCAATPPPADGAGGAEPGFPGKPGRIGADFEFDPLPDFQLFDRTAQKWVEFAHPSTAKSYVIANSERYVDSGGAVLFRFINRHDGGQFGEEQKYFQLLMRLEGTIG